MRIWWDTIELIFHLRLFLFPLWIYYHRMIFPIWIKVVLCSTLVFSILIYQPLEFALIKRNDTKIFFSLIDIPAITLIFLPWLVISLSWLIWWRFKNTFVVTICHLICLSFIVFDCVMANVFNASLAFFEKAFEFVEAVLGPVSLLLPLLVLL